MMETFIFTRRWAITTIKVLLFLGLTGCTAKDWRTANRESAGTAPNPNQTREAVLQIYGAPTWGWRGWFAIHTWIAVKPTNNESYMVYEVIGWRLRRGLSVVRIEKDLPDRYWYGERPRLLKEFRGDGVDKLINDVDRAAKNTRGLIPIRRSPARTAIRSQRGLPTRFRNSVWTFHSQPSAADMCLLMLDNQIAADRSW